MPQQPNPDQSHQTHDQKIKLTRGSRKKQDERRVLRSFSHEQSMKERGENVRNRLQKGK